LERIAIWRNDITGKSSIEFWTKLKKTTTKWNPEGGRELDELETYGKNR
jgi:hypothetical protein